MWKSAKSTDPCSAPLSYDFDFSWHPFLRNLINFNAKNRKHPFREQERGRGLVVPSKGCEKGTLCHRLCALVHLSQPCMYAESRPSRIYLISTIKSVLSCGTTSNWWFHPKSVANPLLFEFLEKICLFGFSLLYYSVWLKLTSASSQINCISYYNVSEVVTMKLSQKMQLKICNLYPNWCIFGISIHVERLPDSKYEIWLKTKLTDSYFAFKLC